MTIILHLALLVAIGAGPVAAKVEVPINFQSVKQVAKEVEAKASAEEIETLRTLLSARSKWHPNAPQLLHNVLSRTSGMHERRLESCSNYKANATCTQMADQSTACNPCTWSAGMSSCWPSSCSNYDNQTACCANARKVKTGCYWNDVKDDGECVELGKCQEMAKGSCSSSFGTEATSCPEAQSVCEGLSGCQWNSCGGCQETGTTCQCSGSSASSSAVCSSGGGSGGGDMGLIALATGNTGCGIMDCALCLKKDENGNADMTTTVSCDTIVTRSTSFCSAKCSKVVHNADEAKCFAQNEGLCGQTVAECKADSPPNSCVPTTSSTQTCAEMCTAFDAKCESSGTKSDCTVDYTSAAWSLPKHSPVFFASALAAASLAF